jgi:hypothetical protein
MSGSHQVFLFRILADDQLAVAKMSFNEHPDAKAAEVAAPLKEWPLKISMLILWLLLPGLKPC